MFKLMQAHLQDSDPEVRNEALYGCLALHELDPKATQALIASRLRDPNPLNRSLILDFLEQHPVPALAPELETRLSELGSDSSEHFPSPEDELHPPGKAPEEPEPYRVVRALFKMGPLNPAAWNYLETRGLQKLDVNALLPFVALSGPEGGRLADLLLPRFPTSVLAEVLTAWGERGVSLAQLDQLQSLIEKLNTSSSQAEIQKIHLLGVLANSPLHPRSIELATAALKDPHPEVQAAAIFALSKLDPQGPGGKAAIQTLQQFKQAQSISGHDYLVLASDHLGVIPGCLAKEPLLHPQLPAPDPHWMHSLRDGSNQNLGTRLDLVKLQMRWLEAHPAQARKIIQQIQALSHSSDSRVGEVVRATLGRLGGS
ncbi:HEAT repeat domain-containing protein [bacterium]|nr:HEAT repeat domain-containing protein [bacterium]